MVARKPVWAYPKVAGSSPPERWGHSSCHWEGTLFIFGGCCGGVHLSDVVALDLKSIEWRALKTSGEEPGTRDSHSAVIVGHQMLVFGGTNGSTRLNSLHLLDLRTGKWTKPAVEGAPPSPRESHTATVVGDGRILIFGGSGEGEGNYLNDVHVLDVWNMKWISPDVKGQIPARRDSHTAVAVENTLVVYGGDCGDHYVGDVDVLDLESFTWARVEVQGSNAPGVRAGHASVSLGSKVYVIGGVGDRLYYNDVWMMDMNARTWLQLDVGGPQPQGRFSHSAVLVDHDIAIYGGCGEDERPLDEILLLQLDSIKGNQCNNLACKDYFGQNFKRLAVVEEDSTAQNLENGRLKRRKACSERTEVDAEQEEQSHSISRHSSPSQQSEPVVTKVTECGVPNQQAYRIIVQNQEKQAYISSQANMHLENPKAEQQQHHFLRVPLHVRFPHQHPVTLPASIVSQPPSMQSFPSTVVHDHNSFFPATVYDHNSRPNEVQSVAQQLHRPAVVAVPNLIGAEVRGVVDAAFDSGYLMTAQVNGHVFRGLLFSAAPGGLSMEPRGLGLASPYNNNKAGHQHQSTELNGSYMNGTLVGGPVVSTINNGTQTLIPPATDGGPGCHFMMRTTATKLGCVDANANANAMASFGIARPRRSEDDARPRHETERIHDRRSCGTTSVAPSRSHDHLVWQPLFAGTRHQHAVGGNSNDVEGIGSEMRMRMEMDGKSVSNLQMGVGVGSPKSNPITDVPGITLHLGGGAAQICPRK